MHPPPWSRLLPLVLALSGLGAGLPALAEKADKNKPMNVVADTLRYDDLQQVSEFNGHVVLTKGTLIIRADKVLVRQDPQGFQYGTATATPGKRAFFRQKRENVDEWLEGEAETLIYDGKSDTLRFTRNAVIRRYKGATLADESSGHLITYDNTTDQFSVDGERKAGPAGELPPGGRIRTMLSPKTTEPATPVVQGPAPHLRTSTRIAGELK